MGWTDDAAEVHMAERQYDLQRKRQECEIRTMPSVAMNLPHTADSNVTLLQLSSEMENFEELWPRGHFPIELSVSKTQKTLCRRANRGEETPCPPLAPSGHFDHGAECHFRR
jgi:hypothetical protein